MSFPPHVHEGVCADFGRVLHQHARARGCSVSATVEPADELLELIVLAVTLPWFAAMGGYVSRLRDNMRDSNRALEAAKTLVGEAFVKPVLASLRDSGLAADAFKPGTAEKRFRPMFDAMLSDRVVESSHFALVERVADRFERSMGHTAKPEGAAR